MKNLSILSLLAIFLVSCAPASTAAPVSTAVDLPTATPEPTATFTPEPTATPELFDVQVLAFWDYNGNGIFDGGEPPIEGIVSKVSNFECTTGVDGICIISVPEGNFSAKFNTTNGAVNSNPVSG